MPVDQALVLRSDMDPVTLIALSIIVLASAILMILPFRKIKGLESWWLKLGIFAFAATLGYGTLEMLLSLKSLEVKCDGATKIITFHSKSILRSETNLVPFSEIKDILVSERVVKNGNKAPYYVYMAQLVLDSKERRNLFSEPSRDRKIMDKACHDMKLALFGPAKTVPEATAEKQG